MSIQSGTFKSAALLFAASSALLSNGTAQAANLGFLSQTPISYATQRDLQAINKAARSSLDTQKDGETTPWDNKGTGNSVAIKGTITPSDTTTDGARTCRKLSIVMEAKGQTQTFALPACKTATSAWAIVKR